MKRKIVQLSVSLSMIVGMLAILTVFRAPLVTDTMPDITTPTPLSKPTTGSPTPLGNGSSFVETDIKDDSKSPKINENSGVQQVSKAADKRKSYVQETIQGDSVVTADGRQFPLRAYKMMATTNDPLGDQWWTDTIGLPAARAIGYGSKQTIIAIVDSGISLKHEEFVGRLYENVSEKGIAMSENPSKLNCTDQGIALNMSCNNIDDNGDGILDNESGVTTRENKSTLNCSALLRVISKECNLVDDDNNGLVDDFNGFDFINYERSVQPGEVNASGGGASHGTMVAGVAAATNNNSVGIAGVNSQARILPIQALSDDGSGDTVSVSRAVRYAADQGADVINLSLGSSAPDAYLRQSVQYAISKGAVVVASAGNDGCRCMSYPAQYEEVIAVGASNQSDVPTSFSSYGPMLDVLAPGIGMTSSAWSSTNAVSAYATNIAGTSFSSPVVAGQLAWLRSHQPAANGQQLLGALTETTNRLAIPDSSSHTENYGFGRVQAGQSIMRATQAQTPLIRYSFYPISAGTTLGALEPSNTFQAYSCENKLGTTALYKLTNAQSFIYTVSAYEKQKGIDLGYNVSSLGYYCMNLPHDRPSAVRSISIPSEFENITPKLR